MKRPNIILLIADQLRYDCVGAAELNAINTPNLDRLAGEGMFFEHAFTPMPVCAPARQCLASGRMADSFGAFWNYDMGGLPCKSMSGGDTWSNRLYQSGYNTAFLGKWHSSETHGAGDFGYGHVVGNGEWQSYVDSKYPGRKYEGGWHGEPSFLELADSHAHYMSAKASELLHRFSREDKPFFLRIDYNDPHPRYLPSAPFSEMYDPRDLSPWPSFGDTFEGKPYIQKQMVVNWDNEGKSWDEWSQTVARYYGFVSQLDAAVGTVLNAAAQTDNTVVIFTSDHGDTCGGHGMFDKHYVLYDDNCRVPLIIRCPDMGTGGQKSGAFVSNMLDLVPTIEELCGLEPSGERHGLSLVPLLKGEAQPERDNFAVSSSNGQQFGFFSNRSIRTPGWRYVWNLTDVDELYDHNADPGELCNLAADPGYADTLSELRLMLYDKLITYDDPFAKGWVSKQLTESRKI